MTTEKPSVPGWYHYQGPEVKSGMILIYESLYAFCWLSVDVGGHKLVSGEVRHLTGSFEGPIQSPF